MTVFAQSYLQDAQAQPRPQPRVSSAVLIVTMILYAGFAIPVSIIAMDHSLVLGMGFAGFLAWQWGRLPAYLSGAQSTPVVQSVTPHVPGAPVPNSGNTSFDAYRAELLERLEKERVNFDGFLDRLRDAKDKSEFDQFMEERATKVGDDAQKVTELKRTPDL